MTYCSDFFYDGKIFDLYYDIDSKRIKFYLDGVEQYIPSLNNKYNILYENNLKGRQLLVTTILSLNILATAINLNGCSNNSEAKTNKVPTVSVENDLDLSSNVSTISVENNLDSSSFYKELYKRSDNDLKKEILDLTKSIIKDNSDYMDQEDVIDRFSQLNIVYTSDDKLLANTSNDIIGRYDPETNTMYLKEGLDENLVYTTIFHEMLHFYSNSGFVFIATDNNGYIGDALNEGMTQVLVNEYFKNQVFVYSNEVSMTKALIEMFGSDFMRKCYFSHDLDSFINEVSKYSSYEDAISLLKNMDNAKVAYNDDDRENYDIFNSKCWDIIGTIYSNKYGVNMETDKLMMSYKEGSLYDVVVSVSKKYFKDNESNSYKINYYSLDEDVCYLIDSCLICEDDRYIDLNVKKKTTK